MLQELIKDIGDSWYSIILDESTDNATVTHLALMVKYFSYTKQRMITDLLGLVVTPQATAQVLYKMFKIHIQRVGLDLKHLLALGTDDALNLCGSTNSLYALLKQYDCPNLHLIKCLCYGLDKCASTANQSLPESLEFLLRESRNWFSHSALRKIMYEELYKSLTDGQKPPQLVRLFTTRWLLWYGSVKLHSERYMQLKTLFITVANADTKEKCFMTHHLAALHEDMSNILYLTFLKPILREVTSMNVVFQSSVADISKVYRDLKIFIFSLANRIIKPEAVKQCQPGMLCLIELQALKVAMSRQENFKPVELVNYGENFWKIAHDIKLPDEKLRKV